MDEELSNLQSSLESLRQRVDQIAEIQGEIIAELHAAIEKAHQIAARSRELRALGREPPDGPATHS